MNKVNIILAAVVAIIVSACSSTTNEDGANQKYILVSIEPQRYIVEQLVDSTYKIQTLLSKGSNPETFEPSMAERIKADSAAVFFATGVLPFEQSIKESASHSAYVNTSDGVSFIFDTHGHDHKHAHDYGDHDSEHGIADPHYWSSIEGGRQIARNVAESLSNLYPADSVNIKQRLVKYEEHLDSLKETLDMLLEKHQDEAFAVWHPSLSYFAREYDLHQISVGTEGKEMSAKSLKDAIDKAKGENVKVFFFQKEFDSRQAVSINDGIGSRIIEIQPLDYDWEGQLIKVANEIARPQ